MTGVDLIVIATLLAFIVWGFISGMIFTLGSIVGSVLGLFLAGRVYQTLGTLLEPVLFGNESGAKFVSFFIIFLVVSQAVGGVFWLLGKAFDLVAIIPGMKLTNRIAGAALGFIAGLFIIGIVVAYGGQLIESPGFRDALASSGVAQLFIGAAKLFRWVAPEALRTFEMLRA